MRLLSDIVIRGAERFADREAIADPQTSWTYAELCEAARRVAGWLVGQGLRPGDRVLVKLPNSARFVAAHFGALLAGGVSVPCDAGASEDTIEAIRRSCSPRATLDADSIAEALAASPIRGEPEREPSDVAALLYTTGTTGRPKGVILTHANVLAALNNICGFIGYGPEDREVVILPLSHSFGLGHVYCNLMSGGAVYTEPGLTRVNRVLNKIESWGATGFPGTPLGYSILMDRYAEIFARKCRNLRFIVINSAPLPPERAAQLRALLPDVDLMVYYGLTEASRSTFISLSREGPAYYASVGRTMPGVNLRIAPDGEVLISGPTVTQGYWGEPELTAAAFRDGWLRTGDIGRLDERGFLFVTGRLKDLINVGGYKVSPEEVERVLLQHEAVVDAGVFGDGRVEAALVAAGPIDVAELSRFCYAKLEPYKAPVRFHTVAALPRSETGKIKRAALAEMLRGA